MSRTVRSISAIDYTSTSGTARTMAAWSLTAGSLVALVIRSESADAECTVSDNRGGTWQLLKLRNSVNVWVAWSWNHPGGSTAITVTFTTGQSYRCVQGIEFSGDDSSDPFISGSTITTSGTALPLNHEVTFSGDASVVSVQGNFSSTTYAVSAGTKFTDTNNYFCGSYTVSAPSPVTHTNTGSAGLTANLSVVFADPAVAPPDTTAPTLTSASASATSGTTSSGSVTTNEANGTLYWLTNTSASATATAVKAGSSQAVTAAGSQSTSSTGLSPGTTYYTHFLHRDAAGNDSTVLSSASFATPALSASITLTTDGTTPAASLTGLTWGWWDAYPPNMASAPLVGGYAGTTNGSGVFTATLTGTTLTTGQTGTLLIVKGDGTEGSTANNAFCGPVVVG